MADPHLFPDALEDSNLSSPGQWASLGETPAVSPPPQVEPVPDVVDDAALAARLLDQDRQAADMVPFEGRTRTRSGRQSCPPPRFKPYGP